MRRWSLCLLSVVVAISLTIGCVAFAADSGQSGNSGVTLDVEKQPDNSGDNGDHGGSGGGTSDKEKPKEPEGDPSGGKDANGDDYHLVPGVHVDKPAQVNGYMIGKPGPIFDMDGELTRAEFAVIMDRVFVFDQEVPNKSFKDTEGHWAESSVNILATNKIILGVSSTEFRPNDTLTRDQALQMLGRVIDTSKYSKYTNLDSLKRHYAKEMIAQVLNSGIYDEIDENFDVSKTITRGEMVHLVNNIIYSRGARNPQAESLIAQRGVFQDLIQHTDHKFFGCSVKSLDVTKIR